MLGIGGKFAASKGMVRVPNLEGLSSGDAQALLISNGLKVGSVTSGSTSNSSLNGKAFGQSVASNTLVDYESVVGFQVYTYVAPPPPEPPPGPTVVSDSGCVYTEEINRTIECQPYIGTGYGFYKWQDRVYGIITYSNGTTSPYTCSLTPRNGNTQPYLTECGYVAPTCSGRYYDRTITGSCSGGQKKVTNIYVDSCGNQVDAVASYFDCCTAAGPYGCVTTYTSLNKGYTTCTYRRTDCSTYTKTTSFCNEYCTTSCGRCVYAGYTVGSYKSCTKNCECAGTSTYSVKC